MTALTQEYFDEKLGVIEAKVDRLPTKDDHEELALMIADGFVDLQKRLDVTDRVGKLEKEFEGFKKALHLNQSQA